jgi:hypothetical protein
VRGVVVKGHEVLRPREPGEGERMLERAVPPADVVSIRSIDRLVDRTFGYRTFVVSRPPTSSSRQGG